MISNTLTDIPVLSARGALDGDASRTLADVDVRVADDVDVRVADTVLVRFK
jgi:hypothetical protein